MISNKKRRNEGKIFEQDIKASIPPEYFVERYKDDTAGFRGVANPADYRVYRYPYNFLLELKSIKGKSLPLDKIKSSQLKGMRKANPYMGVCCGFLINYRDLEETYYVTFGDLASTFYILTSEGEYIPVPNGRKSVPVEWCRENGVRIQQIKKRTRYSYDLRRWLGGYYD